MILLSPKVPMQRLRDIKVIHAGKDTFVYDLERTFVFELPEHIQWNGQASGPDHQAWLLEKDLLTRKERPSWVGEPLGNRPANHRCVSGFAGGLQHGLQLLF